MMAAVTWSGDPADWQLNAGVGGALQRIRGANGEAPLDVVPEHARRLGGRGRLCAAVAPPRFHVVRYWGVLSSH
jgi:hypothetical protein